jgi:pimeloyl-ACP methyl ester carboxylesterase
MTADAGPEDLPTTVRAMFSDFGKIVSEHGVDEARYVLLGGARQWITVRGQDRRAPILLYLHGGPGGPVSDLSFLFQKSWEDYFTVVHWDQRGFGRSAIDGVKLQGSINLQQCILDAIELMTILLSDYHQSKLFLLGQSWGTVLAVEIAHRRPDLLHAFGCIGQVVDEQENFEETRRLLIGLAKNTNDEELAERMRAVGPLPSFIDDPKGWEAWLGTVQGEMARRGYSLRNHVGEQPIGRFETARLVSPTLAEPPPEAEEPYPDGAAAARMELTASIWDWNADRAVGTTFKVPVVIMSGAFDWQTPITLARKFYGRLRAPYKIFVEFPNSAHYVIVEEPGRMIVTLVETMLPALEGRVPTGAEVFSNGGPQQVVS